MDLTAFVDELPKCDLDVRLDAEHGEDADPPARLTAYLRAAAEQDVLHAEVSFDPRAAGGVPLGDLLRGLRAAADEVERERGTTCGLVVRLDASAPEPLEDVLARRDLLVGVELDGDLDGQLAAELAARVRGAGLGLAVRCGPADRDGDGDGARRVRRALGDLGADRLSDAGDLAGDPRLLELVRQRGAGLTCRPDPDVVARLLRAGVRVAVAGSPSGPTAALREVVAGADLAPDEVVQLQRHAVALAWTSAGEREAHHGELDAYESLAAPPL
ncbi:hypothetical protein [Kineococcus sp. SYSU DK004]|uniref:hypothetical protein n=1 Tax=Kineococcus sp. SYSU DK004 TaxID=3383125 RepID=UPI003D7F0B9B